MQPRSRFEPVRHLARAATPRSGSERGHSLTLGLIEPLVLTWREGRLLWTAFARQHHTDPVQHVEWRASPFGKKVVGAGGAVKRFHAAAYQQNRHFGSDLFHPP